MGVLVDRFKWYVAEARRTMRTRPKLMLLMGLPTMVAIATTTSVLDIARETVLAELPFPEPQALVDVHAQDNRDPEEPWTISYPDFQDWERSVGEALSLAAYSDPVPMNLMGESGGIAVRGEFVSPGYMPVLGLSMSRGHFFTRADDTPGAAPMAVLSAAFWRSRMGADPTVVGRVVRIAGVSFEVIGVGPEGFSGLTSDVDVWMPISSAIGIWGPEFVSRRSLRWLGAVGRLGSGVDLETATQLLQAEAGRLEVQYPTENEDIGVRVQSLRSHFLSGLVPAVVALGLASALLLVLVTSNVTGLMLVDVLESERALAIQAALGAGTAHRMELLLVRSLTLVGPGAVLGVCLGSAVARPLMEMGQFGTPGAWVASSGLREAVVLAGLIVTSGSVAAWLPLLLRGEAGLAGLSGKGTVGPPRGVTRLARVLASVQVALALGLTCGAMVVARSFVELSRRDLGYASEGLVSLRVAATDGGLRERAEFHEMLGRLRSVIAQQASVQSAAIMGPSLPTDATNGARILSDAQWERGGGLPTLVRLSYVSEDAFSVLGIPLMEGRDFDTREMDADAERVIIVSRDLAEAFWPGETVIGRQVHLASGSNVWTVVGVVSPAELEGPLPAGSGPLVYFPLYQTSSRWTPVLNILARGEDLGGSSLSEVVRATVKAEVPGLEAYDAVPIGDRILRQTAPARFLVTLVLAFAAMAAGVSVLGTLASFAQLLDHQEREFGIRVALGCSPGSVTALAVRRGLMPGLVGIATGVAAVLLVGSLASRVAPWVQPLEASDIVLSAAVILVGVGLAVTPAKRAGSVDPVKTLAMG